MHEAAEVGRTPDTRTTWVSYHLYYHEDLDPPILDFVRPTASSFLRAGWIDSFFFVRFRLGGPHLRLRLRVLPGCEAQVAEAVQEGAERYLGQNPSTRSLEPAQVLSENRAILDSDPYETDDSVYPDNTLIPISFRPEAERYGGSDLLPPSLDFFSFSSVVALEFLVRHRQGLRATQLAAAFRLLLRQALGFCTSEEELLSCLGYGLESWGTASPAIVAKGDRVFRAQRETFHGLFRRELTAMSARGSPVGSSAGASSLLGEAARRLSQAIGEAVAGRRTSIGVSHLHMTANRLGLINPEETYLSRLLSCTARDLLSSPTTIRPLLQAAFEHFRLPVAEPPLRGLLARAFAALTDPSP